MAGWILAILIVFSARGLAEARREPSNDARELVKTLDIAKAVSAEAKHKIIGIRPGHGLAPRYLDLVLGRKATRTVPRGTPIDWSQITV